MKRFIIIIVAALVTLGVMFIIFRPDIVGDVWLWIVGLIGPIIGFSQEIIKSVNKYLKN